MGTINGSKPNDQQLVNTVYDFFYGLRRALERAIEAGLRVDIDYDQVEELLQEPGKVLCYSPLYQPIKIVRPL